MLDRARDIFQYLLFGPPVPKRNGATDKLEKASQTLDQEADNLLRDIQSVTLHNMDPVGQIVRNIRRVSPSSK